MPLGMFKKNKGKKKAPTGEAPASEPASPHASSSNISLPRPEEETRLNTSGDIREAMEQELTRMRDDLSRAVITCERRETEAARVETDLRLCREDLAHVNAVKGETEKENRRLQAEIASLEREMSRVTSQVELLKEEAHRAKAKVAEKKQLITELRSENRRLEEEKETLQRGAREREQTWHTIRKDMTSRRDDAIREACRVRRQNEKLKTKINKLKNEKSSILLRVWEKKQAEATAKTRSSRDHTSSSTMAKGKDTKHVQISQDEELPAKVLSLELQLYRQVRLVELLLDVIQEHDPQFTPEQRVELTSAFADPGSKAEDLAQKLKFV